MKTKNKFYEYLMFTSITLLIIFIVAIIAVNNSPTYKQFTTLTKHLKNITITTPTITLSLSHTYQKIKNLSSISLYNKSGKLISNYITYLVNNISIILNKSTIKPGQKLQINVIYAGIFNLTPYFIKKTLGVHYFGYKEMRSNTMLVYINSLNATKYFKLVGSSYVYPPKNKNPYYFLEYTVNVTPTNYAKNKTWIFCGGSYVAYPVKGWQKTFSNITLKNKTVSNYTVINVISKKCQLLQVN